MISPAGRIEEFLAAVAEKTLPEILVDCKTEKRLAEDYVKRHAVRKSEMFHYEQQILRLVFWLTSKRKPRNCDCFKEFRPLTESLVRQGYLDPKMLEVFSGD